jgi:hypothetical protein
MVTKRQFLARAKRAIQHASHREADDYAAEFENSVREKEAELLESLSDAAQRA